MSTIYEQLNPEQQKAVYQTEGPLLILAGAGSGKTRTLTHRIAYLIDEKDVNPWNILAITFTNKAAGEMRERVDRLVEFGAESIWVSTFHSTCVRILRRHIESLGYSTSFSIYDTDDQKTLLHQVMKKLDVDQKMYKDRVVMKYISSAKDNLISPEKFCKDASGDYRMMQIGEIYTEYQEALKKNNALDFDDLIMKTVELFRTNEEVLDYYQNRFRYIMVDEYQDTNTAQFELVRLLAAGSRNLCVVGDDDQSIYKFRGANIRNILDFETYFPEAVVIRLEQNYRSTQNILDAANDVIRNNTGRKEKRLWTENEAGKKVTLKGYDNAIVEADQITEEIRNAHHAGAAYSDYAILYRTNAQSRALEERLVNKGIPYQLVGGINFYQRKEIKDILAYLKTVDNGSDDISAARIINVPKRGIGAATIGKVQAFAAEQGISFYEALQNAPYIPTLSRSRALSKIQHFVEQISLFRTMAENYPLHELIENVLETSGYMQELENDDTIENQTRLENIQEFINKAADYEDHAEGEATLSAFLEEVALVADIDRMDEEEDKVILMTLHSAKGLEFDYVYLCGMEDGLFPSSMSINSDDPSDLEEERRLAYVGITRARKELTLTWARQRMVNGETRYSRVSRFCTEIPASVLSTNTRGNGMYGSGAYGTGKSESSVHRYSETESSAYGYSGSAGSANATGLTGSSSYGMGGHKAQSGSFVPIRKQVDKEALGRQFKVEKMDSLSYEVGDRVKHIKFGEGTVLSIINGKRDYEVSVNFDKFGQKRMFASFAKLQKI